MNPQDTTTDPTNLLCHSGSTGQAILHAPTDIADLRGLSWSRTIGSINTDGAYLKATNDDKSLYYKISSYNASQGIYGHEAVNELLAYRVAEELGIDAPKTSLRKSLVLIDGMEHETYVAVSESYKHEHETRVTFENLYKSAREKGEPALSVAIRFGWEVPVYTMFLFDFLIFNRDRHGANLEVLEDNGVLRLSPLFDNGLSFAVSCHTDAELVAFDVMENRQVNNFIGTRSLYENLNSISATIKIRALREDARERIFKGLDGILTPLHQDVAWNLLWGRWEYAKTVCDLRPES